MFGEPRKQRDQKGSVWDHAPLAERDHFGITPHAFCVIHSLETRKGSCKGSPPKGITKGSLWDHSKNAFFQFPASNFEEKARRLRCVWTELAFLKKMCSQVAPHPLRLALSVEPRARFSPTVNDSQPAPSISPTSRPWNRTHARARCTGCASRRRHASS